MAIDKTVAVGSAVAKDLLNRGEKKRSTSEIGDALVMGIL